MTVKELIEELSKIDPNKEVYLDVESKLHYLRGPAIGINTNTVVDSVVYITAADLED